MTEIEANGLVAAVAAWLRFERLCSPSAEWQWERVVYEPLRRYLTTTGYASVRGEATSDTEEPRPGKSKSRFDYAFGPKTDHTTGVIEVKTTTAGWQAIVFDIAKLVVLGRGCRFLLLVGPAVPQHKKQLSVALSFDLASRETHVTGQSDATVFGKYREKWEEYTRKRRNQPKVRRPTPHFVTKLEGLASDEGGPFVAMWSVKSSVGRSRGHQATGEEAQT